VAEILGWPAIAKRLGVSIPTARKWWEHHGLLVYKRNRTRGRQRWCWATTDELILTWRIAKAKVDRIDALEERAKRRVAATVPEGTRRDG
jgi:transposase